MGRGGRYLLTAGDKAIKVWDYRMALDLNFQVGEQARWLVSFTHRRLKASEGHDGLVSSRDYMMALLWNTYMYEWRRYLGCSLEPRPSSPRFYLAALETNCCFFLQGCEINSLARKAGVRGYLDRKTNGCLRFTMAIATIGLYFVY